MELNNVARSLKSILTDDDDSDFPIIGENLDESIKYNKDKNVTSNEFANKPDAEKSSSSKSDKSKFHQVFKQNFENIKI